MKPSFHVRCTCQMSRFMTTFLSIGHITITQASGLYLFARLESRLFGIPTGLNRYAAFGIKLRACHLKVFFYDKSTGPLNMLYNTRDCLVLHLPQTHDNDDTSPFYIPTPDFPSFCTSFWIIILILRGKYRRNDNKSGQRQIARLAQSNYNKIHLLALL